jgi:hypothetical protein
MLSTMSILLPMSNLLVVFVAYFATSPNQWRT